MHKLISMATESGTYAMIEDFACCINLPVQRTLTEDGTEPLESSYLSGTKKPRVKLGLRGAREAFLEFRLSTAGSMRM